MKSQLGLYLSHIDAGKWALCCVSAGARLQVLWKHDIGKGLQGHLVHPLLTVSPGRHKAGACPSLAIMESEQGHGKDARTKPSHRFCDCIGASKQGVALDWVSAWAGTAEQLSSVLEDERSGGPGRAMRNRFTTSGMAWKPTAVELAQPSLHCEREIGCS